MVRSKRRRPHDAGSSQPPQAKHPRLSSSQNNGPRSSLPDGGSSQPPPATQSIYGEEEDPIDLTQDDSQSSLELYGSLENKIVGVRYYNGVATPHELVVLRREAHNQYDSNAIRVDNVMGNQIGHLPRTVVSKLAPYVDRGDLVLEAVLIGEKGYFDCPVRIYFYGTSDPVGRTKLEESLKADKLLKATQLKATRKEAEAVRKSTGLKSGSSSAGLGQEAIQREEQGATLQGLVSTSEAFEAQRTDQLSNVLATGEEALETMPMAEQPEPLKSTLLPYQLQGLAWMIAKENPQVPAVKSTDVVQLWKRCSDNYSFQNLATSFKTNSPPQLLKGGILADDMGLGKTLQIISLILSQGLQDGPTLIVAPVTVLGNWEQQVKFHVKETHQPRVLLYHSSKQISSADLKNSDIVITTYGKLLSESKVQNGAARLYSVNWRRVVLDEGHNIRNPSSQTAHAAHKLQATSRWLLTGTPIINGVKDFLSLLQFLKLKGGLENEGLFGQVITRPIRQLYDGHPDRSKAVKILAHLMKDICLRRRKDMKFVDLKLPPKAEYVHRITFSKTEQPKYDAVLAEARGELEKYQASATKNQQGRYSSILERLLRLRQICNHWMLCKERVQNLLAFFEDQKVVALDPKNIAILQQALQLIIESQEECAICYEEIGLHEPVITACKHVFGKACITKTIQMQGKCPMCRAELKEESLVEPAPEHGEEAGVDPEEASKSSKTEALLDILQATLKKEGSKVVVFSQWTSYINIVQQRLKDLNIPYTRIDGSMPKKARDASIESLNNDPNTRILLASLQVCSVGLNLVAADTVILADSWWAPAIEDQAVDRVHRLGQTREMTVWRLVVEGTIEERVLNIQTEKRRLVSEAFQEKSKKGKAKETRMADISKLLS
ncbi:SNF2 family N-terminal domain-containing protein [Apiospora rasikravindrae]|uniref:SNF2 family N-terminal domain-containing protein n=1 Tax=Apiospora rasikravindrae TaxID=990691 RepID=A0ABR1TXK9_9PEZI